MVPITAVPEAGNTGTAPALIQLTVHQADTGNELMKEYVYIQKGISDDDVCFVEDKMTVLQSAWRDA